jgi:DNA-binding CsgD family transcriptional regulator
MFGVSGYMAVEAWAALAKGDLDRAVSLGEEAASAAETPPDLGLALLVLSTTARFRVDLVESERLAREATANIGPGNAYTPIALEALGGVLVHLEHHEEAAHLLGSAEALREETYATRFPWMEAIFRADFATARGALEEEAFEAAWAEGRAMTAEEAVAYATRGRGKRRRPSAGWDSLTPTELDVVRLVAEGLTNRQIAEKLFVSPRTVQSHLRSIFAKLGVSTRTELATQATRRDL